MTGRSTCSYGSEVRSSARRGCLRRGSASDGIAAPDRGLAAPTNGGGSAPRCASLELAFRGLDATRAESSWLQGNEASRRVSEKLGYREVGVGTAEPRGVPIPEHEVWLERAEWRCPVPVEIIGLEPCLPLFGL